MLNSVTSFTGMVIPSQTMFPESIDNFLSSIERTEKNDLGRIALYMGSSKSTAAATPTIIGFILGERIKSKNIKMQYTPSIHGA